MLIATWIREVVGEREFYIAPKNDIAEGLHEEISKLGGIHNLYVDSFKNDTDVLHPKLLKKTDIVLVYSPNYWQEISAAIPSNYIYICQVESTSLSVYPIDSFKGYADTVISNTLFGQRTIWKNHLLNHISNKKDFSTYGFEWGEPESEDQELGNYKQIVNILEKNISGNDHVLELGTLGGKWTKYLLKAKRITCVDINDVMIDVIKSRYPKEVSKIDFYISQGDELNGIDNCSIDLVFCIDTLVRSSETIIKSYLREMCRVVANGGIVFLHLPSNDMVGSIERGFTLIDPNNIVTYAKRYFSNVDSDNKLLTHGILLTLKK